MIKLEMIRDDIERIIEAMLEAHLTPSDEDILLSLVCSCGMIKNEADFDSWLKRQRELT